MYKVIKEHAGIKAGEKITKKPRPEHVRYMVANGYWEEIPEKIEKIEPEVKTRKKKIEPGLAKRKKK